MNHLLPMATSAFSQPLPAHLKVEHCNHWYLFASVCFTKPSSTTIFLRMAAMVLEFCIGRCSNFSLIKNQRGSSWDRPVRCLFHNAAGAELLVVVSTVGKGRTALGSDGLFWQLFHHKNRGINKSNGSNHFQLKPVPICSSCCYWRRRRRYLYFGCCGCGTPPGQPKGLIQLPQEVQLILQNRLH